MKKYELTNITIKLGSKTLYRIISLVSIPKINLRKGDLGGFIEDQSNLSHLGTCWIFDDAMVYNKGKIYDNSLIFNNVRVYNKSRCFGNSIISGQSLICNHSNCYGNCNIMDNSLVYNDASVSGNAELVGIAEVSNGRHFNFGTLSEKYITEEEIERINEWRKERN